MHSSEYQPHIDGLRAISVLAVIFYHAKFSFFGIDFLTGGYLGVDVFFVISGYLISRIILIDLYVKKNFSLKHFFVRRIKRILPNLLFVLLIFLFISIKYLLPEDLIFLAKQSISQLFFISNIFFWNYLEFSYMAENSLYIPFLHTWSLSIEEQFYLFLPILLIFLHKFINKNVLFIIYFVFFISFFTSIFFSIFFPSFNFYIITSRAWEFLIGTIFAFYNLKKKNYFSKLLNFKYQNFLSILFSLILFFSFILFNEKTKHPGLLTILPIISSIYLILFLKKENIIYKILITRPLVNIGLISFSLYLWHYPIFAIYRKIYFSDIFNNNFFFILIIFVFIFSYLSFIFVEKKFRFFVKDFSKTLKFIGLLSLIVFILSFMILKNEGYTNRLVLSEFQNSILFNKSNNFVKNYLNKKEYSNKDKLLILGNSHGKEFYEALSSKKVFIDNFNINFHRIEISCLNFFLKNNFDSCNSFLNFKNFQYSKNLLSMIKEADYLIIKTRFSLSDLKYLEETLKNLKIKNNNIYIFTTFPEIQINNNDFLYYYKTKEPVLKKNLYKKSLYYEKFILEKNRYPDKEESKIIAKKYYYNNKNSINFLTKKIKQVSENNNVSFININNFLCDELNKSCFFKTIEGKSVFTDEHGHLSKEAWSQLFDNIYLQNKILNFLYNKKDN